MNKYEFSGEVYSVLPERKMGKDIVRSLLVEVPDPTVPWDSGTNRVLVTASRADSPADAFDDIAKLEVGNLVTGDALLSPWYSEKSGKNGIRIVVQNVTKNVSK